MSSLFDSAAFNTKLFFPERDRRPPPAGARDLHVRTPDGVSLQCRLHPVGAARVGVVLFPGNGEKASDWDSLVGLFTQAGAALAVISHRGYGQSEGEPTLRGALADARTLWDAVAGEWTTLPRVAMGRSLGSAYAAELAGAAPPDLAGVILESAIADLRGLIARRGMKPPETIAPDDERDFGALGKVARLRAPLLVLHGERDTMIPVREAVALHDAAGSTDRTLARIEGLGHNDLMLSPRYVEALRDFFARVAAAR